MSLPGIPVRVDDFLKFQQLVLSLVDLFIELGVWENEAIVSLVLPGILERTFIYVM